MKIRINLYVKFRAFFITFTEFEKTYEREIEAYGLVANVLKPQHIFNFNDKGVRLLVELVR